jgi:Ca2+-binding EF-hand superfamily protein
MRDNRGKQPEII